MLYKILKSTLKNILNKQLEMIKNIKIKLINKIIKQIYHNINFIY